MLCAKTNTESYEHMQEAKELCVHERHNQTQKQIVDSFFAALTFHIYSSYSIIMRIIK